MSDAPKRKVGRQTVWNPENEAKFLEAIELGLSINSSAAAAGVHRDTVFRRQNEDPEFADAIDLARGSGMFRVAKDARDTASIVRLKYCHRYLAIHDGQIEPQKVEHTGGIAVTLADFFDQGAQEFDEDETNQASEGEVPPS